MSATQPKAPPSRQLEHTEHVRLPTRRAGPRQRVEHQQPATVAPLARMDDAVENALWVKQHLSVLHSSVPEVVTFEVGGEHFAVERSLIEKDPQSLLFVLANARFSPCAKSETAPPRRRRRVEAAAATGDCSACDAPAVSAIAIPEKDPALFRKILNVVRGYKNAIPDDRWREACLYDVAFYGLQKSWYSLFPAPEVRTFTVKTSPSFVTSATTCGLASPYYTTGQHVVTFAVALQGAEKVATGVETKDMDEVADGVSHAAHGEAFNRALYWNDGNVTSFFSAAQSFASGFPFKSSALTRVFLDADEGTVRWAVRGNDCVAMLRLPKRAGGYAFCAISQKGARVDIVNLC